MKCLVAITLLVVATSLMLAQSVTPFAVKVGPGTRAQARMLVTDASGNPVRPNIADVTVLEDGIEVADLQVTCPTSRTPRVASITLSIDISASMSRDIPPLVSTLAAEFSQAFITAVQMPPSDMAVQMCDEFPQLKLDFTSNVQRLLAVTQNGISRGGNNFIRHLLDSADGAISIASKGRNERSIVLVTDAFWEALPRAELDAAIDLCIQHKIRFFCVVLTERLQSQTGIVNSFRELAQRTGGAVFDGVTNTNAANEIAETIAGAIDGIEPCDLQWTSSAVCPGAAERTLLFGVRGVDTARMVVPATSFERRDVVCEPEMLRFAAGAGGSSVQNAVRVTAMKGALAVRNVRCTDPAFTVDPTSFQLAEGTSTFLTITYTSDGRTSIGAQVVLEDSSCTFEPLALRVLRTPAIGIDAIAVTEPNGGEEILAASDTVITWISGDTLRPVDVDVSLDDGATWEEVARGVIGLRTAWRVPRRTSDRCRARVSTMPLAMPDSLLAILYDATAADIARSTDRPYQSAISVGTAHGLLIRHRSIGGVADIAFTHQDTITDVVSRDDTPHRILSGSVDGTVAVHDTVRPVATWNHGAAVRAVEFSARLNRCYSAGDNGEIIEWDHSTGAKVRTAITLGTPILSLRRLSGDTVVVVTADSSIAAIDLTSGNVVWRRLGAFVGARCAEVNRTTRQIAVGTWDGSVMVLFYDGSTQFAPFVTSSVGAEIIDVGFALSSIFGPRITAIDAAGNAYSAVPFSGTATPIVRNNYRARATSSKDAGSIIGWNGALTTSATDSDPIIPRYSSMLEEISTVALDRTGTRLITYSESGAVFVWDVLRGKPIRYIATKPSIVPPAISPRGNFILVAPDLNSVWCYDLSATDAAPSIASVGGGVTSLRFDPGSDVRAGVGTDLGVLVLDVPSLFVRAAYASPNGPVADFSWNADASLLALAEFDNSRVSVFTIDAVTGATSASTVVEQGVADPDACIAWYPSGDRFCVATTSRLTVIDASTLAATLTSPLPNPPTDISIANNGSVVAVIMPSAVAPVGLFDGVTLNPLPPLGENLGTFYSPVSGRFAGGSLAHATGSRMGAAVVRNLDQSKAPVITDVSDSLFSIVWPRLATRDVDMGRVRVQSRRDSTVLQLLQNRTRFEIHADSLHITGANASDFRVTVERVAGTHPSGSSARAEVSFTPTVAGLRTAECKVFCGTDTTQFVLTGVGVVPTLRHITHRIDVGAHLIGSTFDTVVAVLSSISSTPTAVTRMCLVDAPYMPFTLTGGTSAVCGPTSTLQPAEDLHATIVFTPTTIGRSTTLLEVETDDGLGPYTIAVTGIGLGPTVGIRSDSGYPGDRRPIVVELRDARGAVGGGKPLGYELELAFNRTVLVPEQLPVTPNGTIAVRGVWLGTDTVVAEIPSRIVLGNADSTSVSFARFAWFDEQGAVLDRDVRLEDGTFRVLGICYENGTRLFDPTLASPLHTRVVKNTNTGIDLEVHLGRDSPVSVEFITVDGKSVFLQKKHAQRGVTTFTFDVAQLARGTYVVRTTAGTHTNSILISW